MAIRDLKNNIAVVHLLDPQDVAKTDTKSSILDTAGFDAAAIAVSVGAITGVGTGNSLTPKLQESDLVTDVSFTDVDAADLVGAFTLIDAGTKDSVTQTVGYIGAKRYVRAYLDFSSGTSNPITACPVGVIGILAKAKDKPVTAPAAVSAT